MRDEQVGVDPVPHAAKHGAVLFHQQSPLQLLHLDGHRNERIWALQHVHD